MRGVPVMKPFRIILLAAGVVALLVQPVRSEMEEFDTEPMMKELEEKLEVSKEELKKLKPVLESKSRELKGAINDTVDQGFADMESMAKELEAASEEAGKQLEAALNSDQVKELKAYLARLDKEALEEVRNELVKEMTALLELSEKQVRELEPILKEQLDKMSDLLGRFAKDTGKAYEEFRKEYGKVAEETQKRLEKALDKAQLEKLEKRLEETREKIHKKLFPGG
jgi:DNA repair exonuclease SbcCD ATPase subunit